MNIKLNSIGLNLLKFHLNVRYNIENNSLFILNDQSFLIDDFKFLIKRQKSMVI